MRYQQYPKNLPISSWIILQRSCLYISYSMLGIFSLFLLFQTFQESWQWPSTLVTSRFLTQDDTFVYSNPNDTYSPSFYVRKGHELTGVQFAVSDNYMKHVIYTPVIIFGFGFFAFIIFLIILYFRWFVAFCLPFPNNYEDLKQKIYINNILFYLSAFLAMPFDFLVFMGFIYMNKGYDTTDDALSMTLDITDTLQTEGTTLNTMGARLLNQSYIANQSCSSKYFTEINQNIHLYQQSIDNYNNLLTPVTDYLEDGQTYLFDYGIYHRNTVVFLIWGIAIACLLFIVFSKYYQYRWGLKLTFPLTTFVYFLYLLLGIFWVWVLAMGGDFCMDPTYNIVTAFDSMGDIRNIFYYYSTCVGNNTLVNTLDDGFDDLRTLNTSLYQLYTDPYVPGYTCPGNTDIKHMIDTTDEIFQTIINTENDLSCPPINAIYLSGMNDGFCGQFYQGIYYIWGSILITSIFIFVLMITATFSCQYYLLSKSMSHSPVPMQDEAIVHQIYEVYSDPISLPSIELTQQINSNQSAQSEESLRHSPSGSTSSSGLSGSSDEVLPGTTNPSEVTSQEPSLDPSIELPEETSQILELGQVMDTSLEPVQESSSIQISAESSMNLSITSPIENSSKISNNSSHNSESELSLSPNIRVNNLTSSNNYIQLTSMDSYHDIETVNDSYDHIV